VTRDPDNAVYYRGEVGGLVVGGFEAEPLPWCVDGVPWEFSAELLEPNFDQFEPLSTNAMRRTPCLKSAGIKEMINGPDGYSPDGAYILGPAPELRNFYVAAGMNCYGIAGAGGVGRALAEWIIDGEPSMDLWSLDIRRFGAPQFRSTKLVVDRCAEYYPKHYGIAWPMYAHRSARGLRRSPLYDCLAAKRAVFGEKNGWERVQWLAPEGTEPREEMTFERPNWHDAVGEEVRAIRDGVALLDQSSFSKIEVRGPGALDALQQLSTRDIDRPTGTLSYTQMCNERGGIECDLTIARIDEDRFYIVTGTSFLAHDLDWISRHLPRDGSAMATDVTSSFAVVNLGGPRSRELLERACDDDVSHEGFPFARCRWIHIGCAPALALRVSYHGELGWELHIPTEFAAHVYETLWSAGEDLGIRDVGYRALESCRLEKGYVYWSADVTPDDNPYEAGLGFNVHLDKGDFVGRDALTRVKKEGPRRKLCCFTLEKETQLFGTEPILHDGKVLGIVTSGGFGHHVEKTIAYGYLPTEETGHANYAIAAFGVEVAATRQPRAVYDPGRERVLS
jgi:4-methylaminobutanoate oxidase (formaldehyde-forming)